MLAFPNKIMFVGFGSVARCTLPILLKHIKVDPKHITIMDFEPNDAALKPWIEQGVTFVKDRVTPENLGILLDSFDVASMAEFLNVHERIQHLPGKQRQEFIWDRIIYANPIKANETLQQLDQYKPLVTYDNHDEVLKIARYAPHSGLVLRLRVRIPDRWWSCRVSSVPCQATRWI